MKILFLTHYFPPEGNAPASRVHEMAKRWVKSGYNVHVITCAPNVPNGVVYEGYFNHFYHSEVIDNIRVTRVWTYMAANRGTFKRILNYVSYMIMATLVGLFVRKPTVLVATSPQFFCGWGGVILSKLRHIPFILEIRDIWPESIVAVGAMKNRPLLKTLEWMEKVMYKAADHIVAVGDGYKQRLVEKGVATDKISVVSNGVDQEVFYPRVPDKALKKRLGLNGELICSYVGTVGMACGLEVILKAASRLIEQERLDIKFLIVGDGATRAELENKARDEGLHNVMFVGRQAKQDIPSFLSISDVCLVHLKGTELFKTVLPSKIFEAAGMAKPIINGVDGYARDLIEQAGAGISIEPENEVQLVDALLCLADDRHLCQTYGQAGYGYVTKRFNRNHLANHYMEIIHRVTETPSQTSLSSEWVSKVGGASGRVVGKHAVEDVLDRDSKSLRNMSRQDCT